MNERLNLCITEAGYDAMAKAARVDKRRLCAWGRPPDDVEITPAGIAAVRDYELAFAIRKAPPLPDGVVSLPVNWPAPDGPTPADF